MTEPSRIAIHTHGGFEIVVPATLDSMTTYVLLEQEDWFEDEIRFVRCAVREGARAIDIGANYGVYTLSLARKVGASGRVFAFEPSGSTCRFLRDSAQRNGFGHVEIVENAVSDRVGTAVLHGQNAELRTLTYADLDKDSESVTMTTLDAWAAAAQPGAIDFIKIDAEGHERAIAIGGRDFFRDQDPLIMMEIRAGQDLDLSAVVALKAHGYEAFGLVPALGVLVPFQRLLRDEKAEPDPYLLNLFLCKSVQRDALVARGLLVTDWTPIDEPAALWPASWLARPAYKTFANLIAAFAPGSGHADAAPYCRALTHYLASDDTSRDIVTRLRHLDGARHWMGMATRQAPNAARLSTLCRICSDFGWRRIATKALAELEQLLRQGRGVLDEPFLAPLARYDTLPTPNVADWFSSSVAEAKARLDKFSSFFATPESVMWLRYLQVTGFLTPALERRRQLIRLKHRKQSAVEPSAMLETTGPDHLNPALWTGNDARRWSSHR